MRKVLSCLRKAVTDFNMIEEGDKVAVAVSGGKDSLVLLSALARYRLFSPEKFELYAVTVDMGLRPFDVSPVRAICEEYGVPYHINKTSIGQVVFEIKKEKNPCSLCANMRRGAVNSAAKELGCNKVALGHHADDVVETFLMSLIFENRLHTFLPRTYLSRMDLTVIRPLIYVEEAHIKNVAKAFELPVVTSPCPACGNTKREEMKELLTSLDKSYPDIKNRLLNAIKNKEQYGLWDI